MRCLCERNMLLCGMNNVLFGLLWELRTRVFTREGEEKVSLTQASRGEERTDAQHHPQQKPNPIRSEVASWPVYNFGR